MASLCCLKENEKKTKLIEEETELIEDKSKHIEEGGKSKYRKILIELKKPLAGVFLTFVSTVFDACSFAFL